MRRWSQRRSPRRAALLSLALPLAAVLVSPAAGAAQEAAEDPTQEAAEGDRVDEALVLYERARERYEAGDFERSALLLEEALALHDAPELHYNLARALQELGRWAEARDEYVAYRERDPDSAVRERVDARIAQLERRLAEEATEAEEARATPAPEPPPPATVEVAPWVVLGAGVVVAAVGAPFGLLSLDAESRARDAPNHAEAFGPANEATDFAVVANVLLGVGAVTGLVGLVWGIVTLAE